MTSTVNKLYALYPYFCGDLADGLLLNCTSCRPTGDACPFKNGGDLPAKRQYVALSEYYRFLARCQIGDWFEAIGVVTHGEQRDRFRRLATMMLESGLF